MAIRKNRVVFCFIVLVFCAACTGCEFELIPNKNTSESSPGFRDGVGSFLFNFDNSTQTRKLTSEIKKGIIPSRVSWYYEKGGTARSGEGELEDNSSSSTDPEKVMEVFNSLSNTVIMGGSHDHSVYTHYFISFTLSDGSECRYDFVAENCIRLGGQNYVVETAADLWVVAGSRKEDDTDAEEEANLPEGGTEDGEPSDL